MHYTAELENKKQISSLEVLIAVLIFIMVVLLAGILKQRLAAELLGYATLLYFSLRKIKIKKLMDFHFKVFYILIPILLTLIVKYVMFSFLNTDLPDSLAFEKVSGFDLMRAIIIVPIVEELLFRAIVFQSLEKKVSWMAALWGSAILFALMHLNFNGIDLINYLIAGLMYGYIFKKTRSITNCMLAHGGRNLAQYAQRLIIPKYGIITYLAIFRIIIVLFLLIVVAEFVFQNEEASSFHKRL